MVFVLLEELGEKGGGEKEKLTLKKLRGIMFCLQTKKEKKGMYILKRTGRVFLTYKFIMSV